MKRIFNESCAAPVLAPNDMTELVRGNEQCLLALLEPLVRNCDMTLDMKRIDRIDAAGVAALISLYGAAQRAGHSFTVCNVRSHVEEILTLVGLEHILVSRDVVRNSQSGVCAEQTAA